MAILATAYKVWNLSKMFYLVNINLESTSKISLERNLKDYVPFYIDPLLASFNTAINNSTFPNLLKVVDVTPVFKKGDKNDRSNYRPISVMKAFAICPY